MRHKKILLLVSAVVLIILIGIVIALGYTPKRRTFTVEYTNPEYSEMEVNISLNSTKNVGGFDISLFANIEKWEIVEDSIECDSDKIEWYLEEDELRILCEDTGEEKLAKTFLTMTLKMCGKPEDSLGIMLDVRELYGNDKELNDLKYTIEYREKK